MEAEALAGPAVRRKLVSSGMSMHRPDDKGSGGFMLQQIPVK